MSCKWWRLVHHPRSPKYNGKHSVLGYECACPLLCQHNTVDEKMGGCALKGEGEFMRKGEVKINGGRVEDLSPKLREMLAPPRREVGESE